MTRLPAMIVFSMEPVGISLFAITKVVRTKAITAADTSTWIQLMSSATQPVFSFFSFSLFSIKIMITSFD